MTSPAAVGDMVAYLLRLGPATGAGISSVQIDGSTMNVFVHIALDSDPEPLLAWLHLTGVRRDDYTHPLSGAVPFTTWEGRSESGLKVTVFGRYAGEESDT